MVIDPLTLLSLLIFIPSEIVFDGYKISLFRQTIRYGGRRDLIWYVFCHDLTQFFRSYELSCSIDEGLVEDTMLDERPRSAEILLLHCLDHMVRDLLQIPGFRVVGAVLEGGLRDEGFPGEGGTCAHGGGGPGFDGCAVRAQDCRSADCFLLLANFVDLIPGCLDDLDRFVLLGQLGE